MLYSNASPKFGDSPGFHDTIPHLVGPKISRRYQPRIGPSYGRSLWSHHVEWICSIPMVGESAPYFLRCFMMEIVSMPKSNDRAFSLPYRQIHLDFHTGPAILDVGADFDPRAFAKTMKQSHVNSVTVFAKCHHGHLYYNTRHAARHPGLKKNLDLLAGQVEALHREGIRAPIYLSVPCDEFAANTHPEWIAKNPDGSQVGRKPLSAGWQILDMSSPYQDYLYEQTAEVLKLFKPVDGIFFDMCWDQPSVSPWALAGMVRENLNPENEADRAQYATMVSRRYMKRYFDQVRFVRNNLGVMPHR